MESEKNLAKKLKNDYCYNGVEADPKESAKILHKLGLLYQEKSPNKVCLLQSAALLTSAILRKPDNVADIEKDLARLCLHILTLAKASNQNILLIDDAVKEAKQKIKMLRETTDRKLKHLGPISDTLKGWKLEQLRKVRSKYIRNLQKDISNQYKDIMQSIAGHVVNILGKPPCKFSVVGMGSIAKEQITPYSDFEHIIVLEEGIQNVQSYGKIMEYFRWFATLLLLIIILVGETVLSFLCIPCLNHPLEEENNWFYDKYTPCGIRPDGFAPHASKNPLGRQTITPDKPWLNELIKPVSEMVKHLESEEGLKEGYHLADMLTKTSFVYGDFTIFEQFEMRVKQSHKKKLFGVSNVEQIKKDLQQFQTGDMKNYSKLDVKRFFYRGSSLFVHALGKLHGCEQNNGFLLIDEIFQRQFIKEADYEVLQFCLAVACEARLRTYSNTSSQNDVHYLSRLTEFGWPSCVTDLANDVGSRALVDCLSISQCLQDHVERCFTTRTDAAFSAAESRKYQLTIALSLGLFEFVLQLVKESNIPPKPIHDRGIYLIGKLCALKCTKQYVECLQLVNILLRIQRKCNMNESNQFTLLLNVGGATCLLLTGKHKRALKYLRKANKILHFSPHIVDKELKARISFELTGRCFLELGRVQKALKYFDLGYKLNGMSQDGSLNYCWCLLRLSKFDKLKLVAEDLIIQRKSLHVNENVDIYINMANTLLNVCCQESGYFNSLPILNKLFDHSDATAFASSSEDYNFDINWYESMTAYYKLMKCMKQAGKHQKENNWDIALCHLKHAEVLLSEFDLLNVMVSKMNMPFSEDYLRVHLFVRIIDCLVKLNRPTEALFYAKRMFRCSLNVNPSLGFDVCINPPFLLVGALFQCGHYRDCFHAAKHTLALCQFFSWENFCTDFSFRATVKLLQTCEEKLGISSSLPYDCTPSVYFLPEKNTEISTAMKDIASRSVSVGGNDVLPLEFSPLLKFFGL